MGRGLRWGAVNVTSSAPARAQVVGEPFHDGRGFVRVITHRFDSEYKELDSYLFPIPHPIRINYDGPTVFDLTTGAPIPTRIDGACLGRVQEVHA